MTRESSVIVVAEDNPPTPLFTPTLKHKQVRATSTVSSLQCALMRILLSECIGQAFGSGLARKKFFQNLVLDPHPTGSGSKTLVS